MLSQEFLQELRTAWFPNISKTGLDRLIDLLEKGSRLLIHGSFTRALPMGCLATHIAWNHPQTAHLTLDAGICWLNRVAGLNPATSHVVRDWDRFGGGDYTFRTELLAILKEFRAQRPSRQDADGGVANRVADLVNC